MSRYEYTVMSFTWGSHRQYTCEGVSVLAGSESAGRDALRIVLAPSLEERRSKRRRLHEEAVATYDAAAEAWEQERERLGAGYRLEQVEERVGKLSRQTIVRERVVRPDGSTRTVDAMRGQAFIEQEVAKAVGHRPAAPTALEELTDDEWLDRLVEDVEVDTVGRWSASIEPGDPEFDEMPFAGNVRPRLVQELNRLGADGWRLVTVSEDRRISEGDIGTSTGVVRARYTLMREQPA